MAKQENGNGGLTKKLLNELKNEYFGEFASAVNEAKEDYIVVKCVDWRGTAKVKITRKDVLDFFTEPFSMSGVRSLGHVEISKGVWAEPWTGDWRPMRDLAEMCSGWFKFVDSVKTQNDSHRKEQNQVL